MAISLNTIKDKGEFVCNIAHLNAMCKKINRQPHKVYDLIQEYGGIDDTVTRETIFSYLANKYYNGEYSIVYDKWLERALWSSY